MWEAGESNLRYLTCCILMTLLTSVAILVPLNTNNNQLRYWNWYKILSTIQSNISTLTCKISWHKTSFVVKSWYQLEVEHYSSCFNLYWKSFFLIKLLLVEIETRYMKKFLKSFNLSNFRSFGLHKNCLTYWP